ncbi:recombinase family protein [Piscibacillus sp. B03]|uniref:recombinase family protein n=1 Tax=Piscibacillus sp. B03 TaxID=3457430 RepID=UPI003FCD408E
MRAALYVRVSTQEQKEHGYSIHNQLEKLEAYCVSQDWNIVKTYNDAGFSASSIDRPALQELFTDIENDLIDVVLFYRLDRFTRSVLDLHKMLETMDKNHVMIKSATEPFDTTTPSGRLFINIIASMAEWERQTIVGRVQDAVHKRASMGKWHGGIAPFGYEAKEGLLFINPEEAKIVEKIFELAPFHGKKRIAEQMNTLGYRLRGKPFNRDNITYILTNPIYIGKIRSNKGRHKHRLPLSEQALFDGIHDSIIKEETFWMVNHTENGKRWKRSNANEYIFTGMLTCSRCGANLQGSKLRDIYYYRCRNTRISPKTCTLPKIREDKLEEKIVPVVDKLLDQWEERFTFDQELEKPENEAELKDIKKKMDKYKELFMNDLISIDELNGKIGILREREKELEQHQKVEKEQNMDKEILLDFKTLWKNGERKEKKLLVNSVFENIVVDMPSNNKKMQWPLITQVEDVDGVKFESF